MGILGFYGDYIKQNIPESIQKTIPENISSLAFDLNGVIHAAKAKIFEAGRDASDSERKLFKESLQRINNQECGYATLRAHMENAISEIILFMVNKFKPKDTLIIAVDGVAPGAKMQQQKARRQKSAMLSRNPFFDGASITPGTEFMRGVDDFLQMFFIKNKMILPPKIIYSSHMVPGEGEHKIMDFYRNEEVKTDGNHILYGLDADLVMLSLLSPIENIYLSRETYREVVNINKFKEFLIQKMGKENAIDEFVFMMFFLGNDFVPKSPALSQMSESINFLIDKYTDGNYQLTKKSKINWKGVKKFLFDISKEEPALCVKSFQNKDRKPYESIKKAFEGKNFRPNKFRSSWYLNALGPKTNKKDNFTIKLNNILSKYSSSDKDLLISPFYSKIKFDGIKKVTEERIENMCHDYLITLSWIYLYYKKGTSAINQDWLYPYYHTPLLIDLSSFLNNSTKNIIGYKAYDGMKTFTVLHQLVAVLPLKSKNLLPVELQPLFEEDSMIRDFFPEKIEIETDGLPINKKTGMVNEEEGVAIVPIVDRNRILDAIAQITFYNDNKLKYYYPSENKYFELSKEEKSLRNHLLKKEIEISRSKTSRGKFEFSRGRGETSRGGGRGKFEFSRGGRGETSRGGRGNFETSRGGTSIKSSSNIIELPSEDQKITFIPLYVIKQNPSFRKKDFLIGKSSQPPFSTPISRSKDKTVNKTKTTTEILM